MTPRFAFGKTTSTHTAEGRRTAQRTLARCVGVAFAGFVLAACTGEDPAGGGGSAGSPAGGGNNATAGTNSTGGSVGNTGGSVGNTGGSVGTTGGSTGTTGGSGGAGPTGGGGGAGPTGGSGGSVSSGGMSGGGGGGSDHPTGPSAGCKIDPPNEAIGSNVQHSIDITGMAAKYVPGYTHRIYCTQMPKGYEPTKPYPVVFYGPGCGAKSCEGNNFSNRTDIILVQAIASLDAKDQNTLVPPNAAPGCFQAGREGTPDSPELNYFDQVMAEVEAKYCVDRGKIYAAGTSSGAWLSNYLACKRGNRVRGSAADSGGMNFDHGECTGGAAVMEMPGDSAVTQDSMKREIGAASVRDMFVKLNGCSATPTQMTYGGKTCDVYGGCANPVAWCNVGGGHQSGNNLLSPVGWAFWSTLQ
jgi:poly(3-hydroxybutyrate) depolymerase